MTNERFCAILYNRITKIHKNKYKKWCNMKLKLLLLGLAAAANVFVAIRFRQPMAFVVAGAIVAVMIYCYLTGAKKDKSQ